MSKREYKIHEMMNQLRQEELENQDTAKKIIDGLKIYKEETEKNKSYDELAKQAVQEIKYDVNSQEKVKREKAGEENQKKTMLKLEYIFYTAAFMYMISFVYVVLRKKNLDEIEAKKKLQKLKINDEMRQMSYLYPQIPKNN
jgi:hypothetical protein